MNKSPAKTIIDAMDEGEELFDRGNSDQQNFYRFLCFIVLEEKSEIYTDPEHKFYEERTQTEIFLHILKIVPKESYTLFVKSANSLLTNKTSISNVLDEWLDLLPKKIKGDIERFEPPKIQPNIKPREDVDTKKESQKDKPHDVNYVIVRKKTPQYKKNENWSGKYTQKHFSSSKTPESPEKSPQRRTNHKLKSRPNSPKKGLNALKISFSKIFKTAETQEEDKNTENKKKVRFQKEN